MKYVICERSYYPAKVGTANFRRVLDSDDVLRGYGEFEDKTTAIKAFDVAEFTNLNIIPYIGKVLKSGKIKPVHYFRAMDAEWAKPFWERKVKEYWTLGE